MIHGVRYSRRDCMKAVVFNEGGVEIEAEHFLCSGVSSRSLIQSIIAQHAQGTMTWSVREWFDEALVVSGNRCLLRI